MGVDEQQKKVTIALVVGLVLIIILLAIGSIFAKDKILPGEETDPTTSQNTPNSTTQPAFTEEPTTQPTETLGIVSMTPADGTFSGCTGTFGTKEVTVTWQSTGAQIAYLGLDTDNAKAHPSFSNLPISGSQVIEYPCSFGSAVVTVTVEDSKGNLAHKSITLTN